MQAECILNLSGWVGGLLDAWLAGFPNDIRVNLSSIEAGTAIGIELGNLH